MHAVRKRILEILKELSQGATVAELAERLEMAPVSVRHHLDILQGDNLICVDRLERKGNVGRPQQIYALTEEAHCHFPNNFAALAGRLVQQIKQMLPPEQVPQAFRAMAQEMAAEFLQDGYTTRKISPKIADNNPTALKSHLEKITAFLNDRGYLASWEIVDDEAEAVDSGTASATFLLHKYNCPYAGVASEHSELCLMDQNLINELTGHECERVKSMVDGAPCCTYRVAVETDGQLSINGSTCSENAQRTVVPLVFN